jgi:S1-C subfamily serine protease
VGRPGVLILVVVTVAVAVFAHAGKAAAPERLTLAQRLDLGVVAVEARVGGDAVHGSGTVVDADRGLVLTSARAVWGATSLKLSTALGTLHGRIVARAPCDEIALVETQPRLPGLVSLAAPAGPPPAAGALVTAYGRRLALPGPAMLTLPARVSASPLRLDARLVPEAAGGPVLDSTGRLVGIASAEGGTIPWAVVQQRMAELRPGPRRTFGGWQNQYGCAKRLHRLTRAAHPAFRPADARLTVPVPATRVPGTGRVD